MNSVNNNRRDAKSQKEFKHLNTEITGLIISAGLSKRMQKFKPLLDFNGKTFLKNVTCKLSKVCKEVIIVTGYNSQLITSHISLWEEELKNKIKIVHNSNYKRGMFTSLKCGVEQCNTNWLLYHFVDQPHLPAEFYSQFYKEIDNNYDWLQPVFEYRKGHPILFNGNVMCEISKSLENLNLKDIASSKRIRKKTWQCNYPEVLTDFDTPDDLTDLNGS